MIFRRRRVDQKTELALTATRIRLDAACDEIEHLRHTVAAKDRENEALRHALADLGRQLHGTQTDALGQTVPLPRVHSVPTVHDNDPRQTVRGPRHRMTPSIDLTRPGDPTELITTWPPKEWAL